MIHPKLQWAIEEILTASFDALRDPEFLTQLLRETGLFPKLQGWQGTEGLCVTDYRGLLQLPREFAHFLAFTTSHPIRTVLDIGTFNGWSTCLMTAYLYRWNPSVHVISLDPRPWCSEGEQHGMARLLPVSFSSRTSAGFAGQRFDLCFIDGDHSYAGVRADYFHVGQYATLAVFHDINGHEPSGGHHAEGGVPRFWQELKRDSRDGAIFHEITHCPPGQASMGIGVRIRC
jgi:hypothetical protein